MASMRNIVRFLSIGALVVALATPAAASPSFVRLGADPAGDHNGMPHIDLTAVYMRQRGPTLDVAFEFVDLREELQEVSGLRWDLGDGGKRYCCTIWIHMRGVETIYELTYRNRCKRCGRTTIEIEGDFDAARERITVSVPLPQTPLRPGDALTGCGFVEQGHSRTCGARHSGCTSPGMYGYDCFSVRKTFRLRGWA